ncbi:hypothetical protein LXA47_00675 [Massilia sp. P8910]|uniref:hypothetical protein n=1 Tax=Massilia antarctica TaxID=2765360 RepID=UPI001E2D72D4|nr:hypothetical protein [Massilia antarctica]MCE3602126.1 hypothetical protein [Massilia antarctica]
MNSTVNHHARTLAACGALFCAFGAAQANPAPEPKTQFAGNFTSSIDPKNGDVKVCFKEIGVKNKAVTYTAKAEVVASYACRNPGGRCPPGQDTIVRLNRRHLGHVCARQVPYGVRLHRAQGAKTG